MKKEYSKPYLVAETFEPQEYCAPCTKPYPSVTSISGWGSARAADYIDLNGDGFYQTGERFDVETGKSVYYGGIPDQTTSGKVGVYYFTLGDGTQNLHTLSSGDPYDNHTSGSNYYKVKKLGNYKITIEDRYAFIKTMS